MSQLGSEPGPVSVQRSRLTTTRRPVAVVTSATHGMTPFYGLSFTRPYVLLDVADGSLQELQHAFDHETTRCPIKDPVSTAVEFCPYEGRADAVAVTVRPCAADQRNRGRSVGANIGRSRLAGTVIRLSPSVASFFLSFHHNYAPASREPNRPKPGTSDPLATVSSSAVHGYVGWAACRKDRGPIRPAAG